MIGATAVVESASVYKEHSGVARVVQFVANAPFERRVVASLASLYAFRMLGLFMVLPVLALYGDDYSGSSPFLLGVALGAYGFSQALLQIPFGVLSDRIGRKPVIIAGLLIFTLGSMLAAQADTMAELIAGRILQGAGAIAAAVMALLADLTADENRTKAMAVIGASIGASFSLALVLGPLLAAWGGMAAIFWVTAALGLVGIYLVWQVVPSPARARPRYESGAVPALLVSTLKNPELMRLNLGIFVLHLVLMASFIVVPQMLEQDLGLTRERHWLVYLPLLVGAFIAMLPFIIVAERRRKMKPVFLGAIALLGLAVLSLLGAGTSLPLTLLALFGFFMAFNLLEATLPSLVSKIAPAGGKGTATGIYSTCQFAGAFAGGVMGGWLWQNWDIAAVLTVCAGLALLWWLVALFMRPPRFLASLLIPLQGQPVEVLSERLRDQPGVVEVVVIPAEGTAYLKVDPRELDRSQLDQVVASLIPSEAVR
ncbi:MFS transporter [Marinimicrobium sp. ABcell2]|uniref:MFS transporter n=1 Tax=Marinimicrobium sp. ABcell2 TaxID=3069751 RepID=UPI0027AEA22B|nr:MFS transporter [Marinimicrobium sp. ABcell2]MDQ2078161.1 MFS transporter [Marinimicrobium sp. ABcell2]